MDSNLKIGNEGSGLYVGNSPILGGGLTPVNITDEDYIDSELPVITFINKSTKDVIFNVLDDLGVESRITSKAMSVQVVQLSDMNRKLQVTEPAYIQYKCTYYDDNYQGSDFYTSPSEVDSGSNLQVEGFGYTAVVIIYPM